jgi:hypothetical protein
VAGLLRSGIGVADLEDHAARAGIRERFPEADAEDLLLLDDLLGIADEDRPPLVIDPDARRRRVTAMVNAATLARTDPALVIIEDAHWIDDVSDSLLADFLTVIPMAPSLVLITSRPEYHGALTRAADAQTIILEPLNDSATSALLTELLGSDPSLAGLAAIIAERAAGNPFFAEEMVRELAQRGVLTGGPGSYVSGTDIADIAVPATVQAAIEARIDGLTAPAKRTLHAASVIGTRFDTDLLAALDIEPDLDEPLAAELIDQMRFGPNPEYTYRHPLIRAVAYESQLKTDRAHWHQRIAAAIESRDPTAADENAALIAEHLRAAGELHTAYGWHMRAGAWSANHDVGAARVSWERARQIADALPGDDPQRLAMRIAARTMLCATDFQARTVEESRGRFAELRELCAIADDKVSLAIGMTALGTELNFAGRLREAARLSSEQVALLESIGDPTLIVGLAFGAFINWFDVGDFDEILRWSQTVIDQADGDPAKGAGFGMGSPLAIALAFRGVARCWLGRPGWRQDFDDAVAMAGNGDPATQALVLCWTYGMAIVYRVLRADDATLRAIEEVVQIAERASSDTALIFAEYVLGAVLLNRDTAADRQRGLELLAQTRAWLPGRIPSLVPVTELMAAPEAARRGDRDEAITELRNAVDALHLAGRLGFGVFGTCMMVETLLERGTEADLVEAQRVVELQASPWANSGSAIANVWLLRLRALVSRARGDDSAYRDFVRRYRATAESLGFEGHVAQAEAMINGLGQAAFGPSG